MTVPRYKLCTIWSKGTKDPYTGLETLGESRVYQCAHKIGSKTKLSDSTGAEFVPKSTYWVRLSELVSGVHKRPSENEMIAEGDHSGVTTPADVDAEIIRAVLIHDHTKFGQSESYTIGTNT